MTCYTTFQQVFSLSERLTTELADMWFLTTMDHFMSVQATSLSKGLTTEFADVRVLTTVYQFMSFQADGMSK